MFDTTRKINYLQSQIDNHQGHVDDLRSSMFELIDIAKDTNRGLLTALTVIELQDQRITALENLLRVPDDLS